MANTPAKTADENGSGTVATIKPHERFRDYLQNRAKLEGTSASEVSLAQVDRVLTMAESDASDEDIMSATLGGTIAGKDLIDTPITVRAIRVGESGEEYENPLGVYILIHATLLKQWHEFLPGTDVMINTGASDIVTKLQVFERRERFPMDVVIRQVKGTKGVLKLEFA